MKRLNDTVALTGMVPAPPATENEEVSISIRAIDNGYICRTSHSTAEKYECSEEYYSERPKIEGSGVEEGANPMRDTVDYLNSK